jgi:outer membrane protein TolC
MAVAIDPTLVPPGIEGAQPVDAYIQYALAENRGVQSARANVLAMKERVPQVTALEDPMVENTIWPSPMNGPQYSLMGYGPYSLMISQQFPWFGTLRLRGAIATKDVEVALAELCAAQLDVVSNVKRAYYGLYQAQRLNVVLTENRKLAEDFVEIAKVRFEGGNTSQQDVLRAQNVITEIDTQLAAIRQDEATARAALARQLHVGPETDLRALPELPDSATPAQVDFLYRMASAARPELRGQLAAIARDKRAIELARKKYHPDFSVGLGYMMMTRKDAMSDRADGRDNYGLVVGFNLPVYRGKLDAGVREAQARALSDSKRFEDLRDETYQEVKDAFTDATTRREILELFRDTYLPRSKQALESAAADYRAGKLDFLSLITAWRELLDVEVQIARLEADLGRALAMLERSVGTHLVDSDPSSLRALDTSSPPPTPASGESGPFSPEGEPMDEDGPEPTVERPGLTPGA